MTTPTEQPQDAEPTEPAEPELAWYDKEWGRPLTDLEMALAAILPGPPIDPPDTQPHNEAPPDN